MEQEEIIKVGKGAKRNQGYLIPDGEIRPLSSRSISADTCAKWKYEVTRHKGRPAQVANYFDKGRKVAQKVRYPDKDFTILGDAKAMPLYGQWLWPDSGKRVVITEGEIDALSVSQLQNNKWPVVSLPNGAQGAVKAIKKALEWLEGFDEVVLMFDQDDAGQEAIDEVAPLFRPGKCKIASIPLKDANEMLVAGRGKELISAIWDAKAYRPDGIVSGDDITLDYLRAEPVRGYDTQYPLLNAKLFGLRKGELTLFTAGTGVGKSTIVREIGYHFNRLHGLSLGNIFLEENYRKTAQSYIALDNDIPLGRLRANPAMLPDVEWERSRRELISNGRTYFYNHFGSVDEDNLLAKLRYFAVGLGVDYILLDHISIVVSGLDSSREGERKDIDKLMTHLRALIEETGVGVIAIAHLAKSGQGHAAHEEGGRVRLNDLRGSGTLKQIPDNIIALERDQQDEEHKDEALIRVLKNREHGDLGPADVVRYDHDTGRLRAQLEEALPAEEEEDVF